MAEQIEPGSKEWALDFSKASSETFVKFLVDKAGESILAATLISVEEKLRINPNNELLSHNFLYAIACMLERYKLTGEAQLLLNLRKILQVICQDYHVERSRLVQMGIMGILSDIMTREAEKHMSMPAWTESDESIAVLHIISGFFPAIDDQNYHDITSSSNEFLCKGPSESNAQECGTSLNLFKFAFPKLFKICQKTHCSNSYKFLFLKMIYWGYDLLSDLVQIDELIRYTKNLINTNPCQEVNIVIGFSIVKVMSRKYVKWLIKERMDEFLKVKKPIILSWPRDRRFDIILSVFDSMATYWLSEDTISKFQIDEQNLFPTIETINSTLNHIMPEIDCGRPSQMSMNIKYNNLGKLVKDILNLPDISRHKGKLTVSPEGIRKFNDLVTFIVKTVDALIIRTDIDLVTSDLCDIEDLPVPIGPMDITWDLDRSACFNRVLGSSKSPEKLRTNPLVKALRLLSIFYEVNENWGILFGSLSSERLIDRSCFISEVLKEYINIINEIVQELNPLDRIPKSLFNVAEKYPFLMSMGHRQYLFRSKILITHPQINYQSEQYLPIIISRNNLFRTFAKKLNLAIEEAHQRWEITFIEEPGTGRGATKEFYTEFSRDCQRFHNGLWSGEAGEVIEGVSYVKPQSGLFPSPKFSSNPMTNSYLYSVGVIMAKSIIDRRRLDINFSHAFYKCLFKKNLDAQQLSLTDIKDVMPSIFKFVESLVDALREKWCIRMDNSLTIEEQNKAISNITCDGCTFEDLCVNFTLPGFPDIEMMEGGSDTILSIDNLENYLKLLIWWILYENPQKSIKEVRKGFERILDPSLMQYFYPHEFEELFCGLTKEQWTVDILKQNCVLEGLTVKKPVVQYLFEVLSSLSANDQRHFLQFVIATPRLPVGGLAALNPKLTISYKWVFGNPDNYLPVSFTCSNTLLITDYSCKEALEEKLLLAIREGRNSFDFS